MICRLRQAPTFHALHAISTRTPLGSHFFNHQKLWKRTLVAAGLGFAMYKTSQPSRPFLDIVAKSQDLTQIQNKDYCDRPHRGCLLEYAQMYCCTRGK